MPIKVALDTTYAGANQTGVGLYSARLARELAEHANEWGIELACFGSAAEPGARAQGLTTTIQEWPISTHGALPIALLANKPDIVHSTAHIGPLWGPGKLIVTVHDLIFMRYPEDYNRAWLATALFTLPKVLKRAKAIIADSHATKADIVRFFGIRPGKIVVIYPGVDRAFQDAPKLPTRNIAAISPASANPYLLCLGPWVRRKNLEVVVDAFARIAPRFPDLHLVITGKPSRGMKGYTEAGLLGGLPPNVRKRVRLTGYVAQERLYDLVAGASVLAYPSRWEGFGLPPLEAMLAGVPVVASLTPAVEEVTEGAAMLCDSDNPFEWAKTLEIILRNRRRADELIALGRARAGAFTWERCARETAQLYHRVAGR